MKKLAVVSILFACATTLVSAGEVLGKITSGGASVGEGAEVSAKCGGKSYPSVKTDKSGTFHLVIAETGKCTLTITHKGQAATVDVASYDDAAQVDLVLEAKDGKLTARRK